MYNEGTIIALSSPPGSGAIAIIRLSGDDAISKTDLLLSKDKVKDDGYIMGHDFINYDYINKFDYGVKQAVHDFLHNYDYEMVYLTLDWNGYYSYCLKRK